MITVAAKYLETLDMKRSLLIVLILAIIPVTTTYANDKFKVIKVGMAGNGCPEATESTGNILVKQDDKSVRVISPYFALPGNMSERTFIRSKCDVAVSVKVADGYQVGIKATAKAFIDLDDASESTVELNTFFAGEKSDPKIMTFQSATYQNLELSNHPTKWSPCGADSILRMKVSATLRGKDLSQSYLRINSFGLNFEYRVCS